MTQSPSQKEFRKRTAGRLAAVQALFQLEQTEASPSEIIEEFLSHRFKEGKSAVETTFFSKLVAGTWKTRQHIDELLTGALKTGWTLDRLDSVTRAILRAALYEIINTKTPIAVIIDEYLNLTHSFCDEAEVSFVNGVLNTLGQKIRPPASS